MAIQIDRISPEQRDLLLGVEEGHFIDVKAIDVTPAKLTRSIAALANSDGGELLIGIDEVKSQGAVSRHWRGFSLLEAANAHLQVFESLFPLGRDFQYNFLNCPGSSGYVLQINICKTRDIKKASDGRVYIRRGAQNLPVESASGMKELEYCKGLSSFESETVNCPPATVCNSTQVIDFMLKVVPTSEPDAWLRKQQLLATDKPTVAGVLLFADEPQALLPKRCGIKVYRYKTNAAQGFRDALASDPITVEGCSYSQIQTAVDKTIAIIEEEKTLGKLTLEAISYPRETVHEIVTNAVIHRDYSFPDDIHIRIFDNRIEVESPGRLPGHITVKNILEERFARNGNIVRVLNKFPSPPNKDVGEGLNTAFDAMTQLGLKAPTIQERENTVLVVIKHERLASPEQAILEFLREHDSIRNSEARKICHVTASYAVQGNFKRLVERGLIEKVPGTKTVSTRYRLTKKGRTTAPSNTPVAPRPGAQ